MGTLESFGSELAKRLSAQMPEVEFAAGESGRVLYEALERPLVCISLAKIEARDSALGGYMGTPFPGGGSAQGRRADISVSLAVYCPEADGPERCGEVFAALCGALLFDGESSLREIGCGAAAYLPKREAYRLDAHAKCGALLLKEGGDGTVNGFRLEAGLQ